MNPARTSDWLFKAFLLGIIVGFVFGILTVDIWDLIGPYKAQISAALWGLVGGVIGLVIGLIQRRIKRGNKASE